MSHFPLTTALGLEVLDNQYPLGHDFVRAADLEALLKDRGFNVATCLESNSAKHYADCNWSSKRSGQAYTHEALLLYPKPIVRECKQHIPKVWSPQVVGSREPAASFLMGCKIVCSVCDKELMPTDWSAK